MSNEQSGDGWFTTCLIGPLTPRLSQVSRSRPSPESEPSPAIVPRAGRSEPRWTVRRSPSSCRMSELTGRCRYRGVTAGSTSQSGYTRC